MTSLGGLLPELPDATTEEYGMTGSILVEEKAGHTIVILNRPEKLNTFNEAMHLELRAALDRVESNDQCRALLITGAGRGFCAGQDLGDRVQADPDSPPPDLGSTLENFYNPLVRRLRALPMPVVCAVNGVAAGAGANIALACDIVLAARSAKFIQAFAKLGLVPDAGGTYALPRLIGPARARGLAMLAEPLTAERAEQWGLIWKVVDDEKLMDEADTLAAHLATQPTFGLAQTKRILDASLSNSLDEQLNLERDFQRRAGTSHDYAEGVSAFMNKRAPKFSGKPPE